MHVRIGSTVRLRQQRLQTKSKTRRLDTRLNALITVCAGISSAAQSSSPENTQPSLIVRCESHPASGQTHLASGAPTAVGRAYTGRLHARSNRIKLLVQVPRCHAFPVFCTTWIALPTPSCHRQVPTSLVCFSRGGVTTRSGQRENKSDLGALLAQAAVEESPVDLTGVALHVEACLVLAVDETEGLLWGGRGRACASA